MRTVTEAEFFAALKADPRDIMPSIDNPYVYDKVNGYTSTWKTKSGIVFGTSWGGTYLSPTPWECTYQLA